MRYLLILCSLLAGCVTFDTPFKPEFYRPDARIRYHQVQSRAEMDSMCGGAKPEGITRLACSRIPLDDPSRECVIVHYLNPSEDVMDHERKHCIYGRWHG